jgi:hypothetical protein
LSLPGKSAKRVFAGLTRQSIALQIFFLMDARVKPAHDEVNQVAAAFAS